MPTHESPRLRVVNDQPLNHDGTYVLYWMQMFRRLHCNHALDHAIALARELKKPLVVFEALKLNYPWASARMHTFILQGMRDNAVAAKRLGVSYWPFVETPDNPGRGLVRTLASDACAIVTDDYPAFIVPAHNRALAATLDVPLHLVDSNALIPLAQLGPAASAAAHLRHRIHKQFAEAWQHRAVSEPVLPPDAKGIIDPPFQPWNPAQDLAAFVRELPLDQTVKPVPDEVGGTTAGRERLHEFVFSRLWNYAEGRNQPDDPQRSASSGLSPYLHFGHLSIQEIAAAVLGGRWQPTDINLSAKGKREGFFCDDPNVNSFLDEAITWRDLGYHWHYARNLSIPQRQRGDRNQSWITSGVPQFNFETFDFSPCSQSALDHVLPSWARATLRTHERDPRRFLYDLADFEAAATHDDLWNAAQTELVATGRMHNYLRMLWGKKVLEWTASPSIAYHVLEHLNNKYALDGRDPNSYTGILWCFGLFDRPWAPERPIFGSVRYMSSDATAKKFHLEGYLDYVKRLGGRPAATLF